MQNVQDLIRDQVQNNKIVLYMKGNPRMPQCGFSAKAVQLLQQCGAEFETVDVLSNPQIREGVKQFSSWPTVPQLYINGEFVGGSDIMTDLFRQGELQKLVDSTKA